MKSPPGGILINPVSSRIPVLPVLWAIALGSLAFLPGCTTTIEKSVQPEGEEALLTFPDAKVCIVESPQVLHEVKFYFEMERLPQKDEEPVFGWLVDLPGEEYIAGYGDNPRIEEALAPGGQPRASLIQEPEGTHRFSYDHGMFVVGGFRYPAERNGEIILFRERPGPFTFKFRGRRITIERSSPWKPAVLYRLNREETAGRADDVSPEKQVSPRSRQRIRSRRATTRVLGEEVQVGPHRIVVVPGKSAWTVGDYQIEAPPGSSIVIDRRGEVRSSS